MADTVDIIEKLIQLALKNPNAHERAAAALKAVELIDKFSIPIGANVTIVRDATEWTPPSPDFMRTVDDIMNDRKHSTGPGATPPPKPQGGPGYEGRLMIQDREPVTAQEAWRQRMVDAWRALREARSALESEIRLWERDTHRTWPHRVSKDSPYW